MYASTFDRKQRQNLKIESESPDFGKRRLAEKEHIVLL
jgi:hypothetical protein